MTRADPFSYDTGTPRNRLGIQDAEALSQLERDLTTWRIEQIRVGEAPAATRGHFDLDHLTALHGHIFQDVYEWAGVTRAQEMTIEERSFRAGPLLWKDDGLRAIPFAPSHQVERHLNRTFAELREQNLLRELPREAFADRAALVFSAINSAHPFMEGNGRTQREFILQLAEQAGHPLTFDVVSAARMVIVSFEAHAGDPSGMQRLFREISDPERVALLDRAQGFLDRERVDWQQAYISTAAPGREYTGNVGLHSPQLVVLHSEGDMLVAQTRDIDPDTLRGGAEVHFTASEYLRPEDQGSQPRPRGIDLDY